MNFKTLLVVVMAMLSSMTTGCALLNNTEPNELSKLVDSAVPLDPNPDIAACQRAVRVFALVDMADATMNAKGKLVASIIGPATTLSIGYATQSVPQLRAYSLQLQMALAAEPVITDWMINHYQFVKGLTEQEATFQVMAMSATDKLVELFDLGLKSVDQYEMVLEKVNTASCN